MWAVQGSSRLGKRSARSPTAMIRLLRSPASISLRTDMFELRQVASGRASPR